MERSESYFLAGCRLAITEDEIAREYEIKAGLWEGDLQVVRATKKSETYFKVYYTAIEIDCSKNPSWLRAVLTALQRRERFDVLNASPKEYCELEAVFSAHTDWFDLSESKLPRRRCFKPLPE